MRRALLVAGLAVGLAGVPGFGQRATFSSGPGIPASVTSVRPGNPTPGIPASVTSFRPSFTAGAGDGRHGFNRDRDFDHDRDGRRHRRVVFVPYYPYYPYYGDFEYPYDQDQYAQPQPEPQPVEAEAPAQTIFENRPGYRAPAPVVSEPAPQPAAAAAPEPAVSAAEPAEPVQQTVLVFKDGHRQEIGNYVIVGETLYNLSGAYRSYKIALGDLDLKATIKANEERGLEFHLPSKKSPA